MAWDQQPSAQMPAGPTRSPMSAVPSDPGSATIQRTEFRWDSMFARCHAIAVDAQQRVLGELTLELSTSMRNELWAAHGRRARQLVEEQLERQLRSLLTLRDPG
jgi:hypothetical protein